MSPNEPSGPNLAGVVSDANAVRLPYVVIGGFSVIAHGYLRATKDSDLLVPDGAEADQAVCRLFERIEATRLRDGEKLSEAEVAAADHLRVGSRHGIVDILRGGLPPLDYDTVAGNAIEVEIDGHKTRVAGLRSVVGFKRLANRLRDRVVLEELERVNGELPRDPIPGLDT